jgi:hypothetical protein
MAEAEIGRVLDEAARRALERPAPGGLVEHAADLGLGHAGIMLELEGGQPPPPPSRPRAS